MLPPELVGTRTVTLGVPALSASREPRAWKGLKEGRQELMTGFVARGSLFGGSWHGSLSLPIFFSQLDPGSQLSPRVPPAAPMARYPDSPLALPWGLWLQRDGFQPRCLRVGGWGHG